MYPEENLANLRPSACNYFWNSILVAPQPIRNNEGHPRLRARHMPFPIDEDARDRWLLHMLAALDDAELPSDVQAAMREYFERGATFLINRPPATGGMFATAFQPKEQE